MISVEPLSLTAGEIKYLSLIAVLGTMNLADLRKSLGIHPVTATRLSSSLETKGFIRVAKGGLFKTVSIAEFKHAQLFRKMILELRHIPFYKLLQGPSIAILSSICFTNVSSRKEIAEKSLMSEASTSRSLKKLKQTGVVQKKNSVYAVTSRFQTLKEFVLEFRSYFNQKVAQSFAKDAVIVWERNNEFIIETSRKDEQIGFRLTGPSAFGRFGIALIMPASYYYHSPVADRQLYVEDLIIHSLLIPRSERITLAILLVWKKNEKLVRTSYLLRQATEYRVRGWVEDMKNYIATNGKERISELPPWDEFTSKAEEYGIEV